MAVTPAVADMVLLRPAVVQRAPRRITRPRHPDAVRAAATVRAVVVDTVVAAAIADRNDFRQG